MKYKFTKIEIDNAVQQSLSIADVCRKLGVLPKGGNYKTVKSKITFYNFDTSHFTGKAWNVGSRYRPLIVAKPLSEILISDSSYVSIGSLKKRLYKEGLKSPKCECCGIESWNGLPIVFDLDHINGINTDHRLENLRILCPNCHSQTPTFKGKNCKLKKITKEKVKQKKPVAKVNKEQRKCKLCQNTLKTGKSYCSRECMNKVKSLNIPSKDQLIQVFAVQKTFVNMGKFYNVSDNAVRKWCKRYDLHLKN